MPRVL